MVGKQEQEGESRDKALENGCAAEVSQIICPSRLYSSLLCANRTATVWGSCSSLLSLLTCKYQVLENEATPERNWAGKGFPAPLPTTIKDSKS